MEIRFDWKFWVMLVIALASAAIPVWIWQADLTAKALQVNVMSITPLVKSIDSKLELKVSQGSVELKNPVLSVVEVLNSGGRPIVASDFESPLSVGLGNDAVVRTAALGSAQPSELEPSIDFAGSAVRIKPLLLNPGDRFEISILSDGAAPAFIAHARIAGITSVGVQLTASTTKAKRRAWIQGFAAIPVFVCYMVSLLAALTLRMPHLMRLSIFLIGIGSAFGSSSLMTSCLAVHQLGSTMELVVFYVAGFGGLGGLLLFPLFFALGRAAQARGWPVAVPLDRIRI